MNRTGEIKLDFERRARTGLDEAIFAEGKSPEQLEEILLLARQRDIPLLITRLARQRYEQLRPELAAALDYCAASRTAIVGAVRDLPREQTRVAVVAAGSSDAGVAREAQRTLEFNGIDSQLILDVGVAGLWRLQESLELLRRCSVVIAVAGMDAALPTVLGGLIPAFIVAVPTSVGYGVAAGGHAALNAILASCAPGVTTVNIDNGYGAACAAMRVLNLLRAQRSRHEPPEPVQHHAPSAATT